ncbi:MAG: DUF6020 family protein [Erysipelotrichaceae bacterium]|nr:DUF6020 family protein [Erysipelotrichaceae bacterium]
MAIHKNQIKSLILSLISTLAFCYLNSIETSDVIVFAITFFLCFIFFKKTKKTADIYTRLLAVILSVLLLLGKYPVYIYESTGVYLILKMFITLIGSYLFINRFTSVMFKYFDDLKVQEGNDKTAKWIFWLSFIIIFIAWIPSWLAEYPGNFPPDTINQIRQTFGLYPYRNANPLIHTLIIQGLYNLFSFIKNNNLIFALIGMVQMAVNAFIYSSVVKYVYKKTGKKSLALLSMSFYAFISYNAIYNSSISKDAMYASILVYLAILLSEYTDSDSIFKNIIFIISFILYGLMRTNGYYSLIILMVFAVVVGLFKHKRKLFVLMIVAFVLCSVIRTPVYASFMNWANSNNELLKIDDDEPAPVSYFRGSFFKVMTFQQVANVVVHERELNEKETWLIEEYCSLEGIKKAYNPILVDPLFEQLKEETKATRLDISYFEYLKLWLELFIKYPGDYLEAYVNMTRYYFYPNRYVKTYYEGIRENDVNIYKEEIVSAKFKENLDEFYEFERKLPIVGTVFNPGTSTFIAIAALIYAIRKRNTVSAMGLMLSFSNFFILMACVPVNDEFRYIYPIVASLPFMCAQFCVNERKIDEN